MMMHKINRIMFSAASVFAVLALFSAMISCNQDSIFADIAVEPPKVNPRIEGSPTSLVVWDSKIYVASVNSKKIHIYSDGSWSSMSVPGRIAALAATDAGGEFFALMTDGDLAKSSLRKYNAGDWEVIAKGGAEPYSLQSIYGAGGRLFTGIQKDKNNWDIYYEDGGALTLLVEDTAALSGAAWDGTYFYIATNGKGIYRGDDLSSFPDTPVDGSEGTVMGIMNVNGIITAVTYNGKILVYNILESKFEIISSASDYTYTGAMSIWKECIALDPLADPVIYEWKDSLLLLGVNNTGSYNKGYRELTLDLLGQPPVDPLVNHAAVVPGSEHSSVKPGDKNKYEASLARYSVHDILQVPEITDNYPVDESLDYVDPLDWQPVIFASTEMNGVYALKNGRWNAQD